MPGARIPRKSIYCGKAAVTFYVQTFLVTDSGDPGGKGTANLLKHVWNSHTRGASHQASPDITVQSEYTDEVTDKICGYSGKVHGGNLHPNGGQWGGFF